MVRNYSFHDQVDIEVNDGESDLVSYYDHYFRCISTSNRSGNLQYLIRGFEDFTLPSQCKVTGIAKGFSQGIVCENERYAISWEAGVLTEYTDMPNRATNLWLQFLLGQQGLGLVHCAGLSLDQKGYVFPGFGGVGKTTLIAHLRKCSDFKFFGDDFVAVDHTGNMFSYPSDFSIYELHLELFPELVGTSYGNYFGARRKRSEMWDAWYRLPGQPLLQKLAGQWRNVPDPRGLGPLYPSLPTWNQDYIKVPVSELLNDDQIGESIPLAACILLTRYSGHEFKVESLSIDSLVSRLMGIMGIEFRYGLVYLQLMTAFGVIDQTDFFALQESVFKECFENMPIYEYFIPQSATPGQFALEIEGLLREGVSG